MHIEINLRFQLFNFAQMFAQEIKTEIFSLIPSEAGSAKPTVRSSDNGNARDTSLLSVGRWP